MAADPWFVYIVECADGSLYTGVARDVERRVEEHNRGTGAKYTRGRAPVTLIVESPALDKRGAHRLEYWVKRQRRAAKVESVRCPALLERAFGVLGGVPIDRALHAKPMESQARRDEGAYREYATEEQRSM